jgi:hypothetical protein
VCWRALQGEWRADRRGAALWGYDWWRGENQEGAAWRRDQDYGRVWYPCPCLDQGSARGQRVEGQRAGELTDGGGTCDSGDGDEDGKERFLKLGHVGGGSTGWLMPSKEIRPGFYIFSVGMALDWFHVRFNLQDVAASSQGSKMEIFRRDLPAVSRPPPPPSPVCYRTSTCLYCSMTFSEASWLIFIPAFPLDLNRRR